jgi:hypothetical protein
METAQIIDPGFSVADAEEVEVESVQAGLRVRFRNWQERCVSAVFVDAVSFRWERLEWKPIEGERFDSSHIIHGSEWLRLHFEQKEIEASEGYRHYRLNFNAAGTLQVIAKEIKKEAEQVG